MESHGGECLRRRALIGWHASGRGAYGEIESGPDVRPVVGRALIGSCASNFG